MGRDALSAAASPAVLAAGFVALDRIFPWGGAPPVEDLGGPAGNVAANLAVLGTASAVVARLGADREGALVIDALASLGVDTSGIRADPAIRTPIVIQENAAPGAPGPDHRFSYRAPETGLWVPRHRSITMEHARTVMRSGAAPALFYLDRISPPVLALVRHFAERGALIYAEPTLVDDLPLMAEAMRVAHVVKSNAAQIPEAALPPDVPLRVRTMGAEGLRYALAAGPWRHLAAVPCAAVVDTAGAGDALSASLIAALVGAPREAFADPAIAAALTAAQTFAACACAHLGAGGWRRARGRRA
jgi:sugar/nucleoside kinase (ribokinase family)